MTFDFLHHQTIIAKINLLHGLHKQNIFKSIQPNVIMHDKYVGNIHIIIYSRRSRAIMELHRWWYCLSPVAVGSDPVETVSALRLSCYSGAVFLYLLLRCLLRVLTASPVFMHTCCKRVTFPFFLQLRIPLDIIMLKSILRSLLALLWTVLANESRF